jgi:TonB family protein
MRNNIFTLILFVSISLTASAQDTTLADPYSQGVLELKAGRYVEARESFTHEINLYPNDMNAYFNRGIVNYKLGDITKACEDWRKVAMQCDSDAIQIIYKNCDSVFYVVDHMPEFPGGDQKLFEYLRTNYHIPDTEKKSAGGRIYVSFIVNTTGGIENVSIIRGVSAALDAEAVRVVNNFPPWIPGKHCGKAVKVKYNLPISIQ